MDSLEVGYPLKKKNSVLDYVSNYCHLFWHYSERKRNINIVIVKANKLLKKLSIIVKSCHKTTYEMFTVKALCFFC